MLNFNRRVLIQSSLTILFYVTIVLILGCLKKWQNKRVNKRDEIRGFWEYVTRPTIWEIYLPLSNLLSNLYFVWNESHGIIREGVTTLSELSELDGSWDL